ncbi:DegQ family serine endoprotease, partial [Desulfococcus sp.]|uniref:DegQ family serine endoprotease n=1 Tax=Desulfococcus sp. TaxID=2025834 RepID=UPI003D0C0EF7
MKWMRHNRYLSILTLWIAAIFLTTGIAVDVEAAESDGTLMVPMNISKLAEKVRPAVVNIRTVKTMSGGGRVFRHFYGNPFGGRDNPFKDLFPQLPDESPHDFKQQSLGSGFIIDTEGYIVTNNHVVDGADEIKVRLSNEKEFDAEVIGRDPNTDLALIRIAPNKDLVALETGDSDSLRVGDWVLAIGSPFGLEQTVTAGIVSAKGRVIGAGPYDDFIQTDASINPGNSGGPLLDMNGRVVGINTAIIASGQGIGFAIPVNMAMNIVGQLKKSGEVTRGWLGVGIQDLTDELKEYYKIDQESGVLISQIYEGDPADKGGIKVGDVVIAVDGNPVKSSRELSAQIANLPVGKKTSITLIREGKEKTVEVTLGKRDNEIQRVGSDRRNNGDLGLELRTLDPETAQRFGFESDAKGVLVTDVASGGKAENAGVRQGDLIIEINREPVSSIAEFQSLMGKIKKGEAIRFLMKRPRGGFVVANMTK